MPRVHFSNRRGPSETIATQSETSPQSAFHNLYTTSILIISNAKMQQYARGLQTGLQRKKLKWKLSI